MMNSDQRCASSPISRASLVLFGLKPESTQHCQYTKSNLSAPSPLFIMDLVNQRPNFADIYPNIAAVLQNDPRLPEETNTSWSPCHDDCTGFKSSALRQICDLLLDVEYHVPTGRPNYQQ